MTEKFQVEVSLARYKILIICSAFIFLLGKFFLIGQVDLFQDEVFYWQESQRLSIAYSDMPFMTAWLIHLGTSVLGNSTMGVRLVFLLLGSLIPLLMYWVAKPVVGRDRAFYAGGLCLFMPLLCSMGSIAAPDVALVVLDLLALGFFERATRTGAFSYWVLTGVMMALGFCTHYRFLPFVAAGMLYLIVTEKGRRCWRSPGVWVSGLIGLTGVLPLVYFNFSYDNAAVAYHFMERHPWEFKAKGLLYPLEQALLVTPLFFGFLIAVLISLFKVARGGDDRASLFVLFVLVQSGVYYLLSPFTDQSRVSFHWPLSGYLPLLVYMPGYMLNFVGQAPSLFRARLRRIFVVVTLAFGLFVGVFLLFAHGMQGFYDKFSPQLNRGFVASNSNFAGWKEMAEKADDLVMQASKNPEIQDVNILVGEHYVVASQLEFYLGERYQVYTVDNDKAGKDGRSLQLRLWDVDTLGLLKRAGENALITLLVTERGKYSARKHKRAIEQLCAIFSDVTKLHQLSLWGGIKGYEFYYGENIQPRLTENLECVAANLKPINWKY